MNVISKITIVVLIIFAFLGLAGIFVISGIIEIIDYIIKFFEL